MKTTETIFIEMCLHLNGFFAIMKLHRKEQTFYFGFLNRLIGITLSCEVLTAY